jgi:hypothetical protein
LPQVAIDRIRGNEEALGDVAIREPLGYEARNGELSVCHGCPSRLRASRRADRSAADTTGPQLGSDAASVPGRSGLGIDLQRAFQILNALLLPTGCGSSTAEILER